MINFDVELQVLTTAVDSLNIVQRFLKGPQNTFNLLVNESDFSFAYNELYKRITFIYNVISSVDYIPTDRACSVEQAAKIFATFVDNSSMVPYMRMEHLSCLNSGPYIKYKDIVNKVVDDIDVNYSLADHITEWLVEKPDDSYILRAARQGLKELVNIYDTLVHYNYVAHVLYKYCRVQQVPCDSSKFYLILGNKYRVLLMWALTGVLPKELVTLIKQIVFTYYLSDGMHVMSYLQSATSWRVEDEKKFRAELHTVLDTH